MLRAAATIRNAHHGPHEQGEFSMCHDFLKHEFKHARTHAHYTVALTYPSLPNMRFVRAFRYFAFC